MTTTTMCEHGHTVTADECRLWHFRTPAARFTRPAEATGYLRDTVRNEYGIDIDEASCRGSIRSGFTLEGGGIHRATGTAVRFTFHTYPDGWVDKTRIDQIGAEPPRQEGDPFEGL